MQSRVVTLLKIGGLLTFVVVITFGYICFSRSDKAVTSINLVPILKLRSHNLVLNDTNQTRDTSMGSLYNVSDQVTVTRSTGNVEQVKPVVDSKGNSHEQGSHGHILIYSNYEEQTNGARNLWQLQMWANMLKMRVTEPFAVNSMFGVIGALPNYAQALRFSDYYDIDKWNKMAHHHGGSSLVQWEEFLSNCSRKVIVLYTLLRETKKPIVVTYGKDDVKKYKPVKYEQIATKDMQWLKQNFNIVRVVNFIRNAKKEYPMSLEELNSYVFGDYSPTEVTLVIVNWFGMSTDIWRIQLKTSINSSFLNSVNVDFHHSRHSPELSPSTRVLRAYENYVSQYIGVHKYVGIIFRTHCVLRYELIGDPFSLKSQYLLNCSKQLKHTLDKVRSKWEIFMAYDLGTLGSDGYFSPNDKRLFPLRDQIFSDVFNGSIQTKQRKEMLINAAGGISDRGFIALLEKTIATHADCIILLGRFSSFVESSASVYFSLHPSNACAVSICSEEFSNANRTEFTTTDIPDKFLST
ncbi:uncharacterized protein [Dysidea avara]|uniref:uncharacterized protein n=1 Tax=Dysidea avara TaxID=196820 RepID=UPI0033244664